MVTLNLIIPKFQCPQRSIVATFVPSRSARASPSRWTWRSPASPPPRSRGPSTESPSSVETDSNVSCHSDAIIAIAAALRPPKVICRHENLLHMSGHERYRDEWVTSNIGALPTINRQRDRPTNFRMFLSVGCACSQVTVRSLRIFTYLHGTSKLSSKRAEVFL